MSKTDEMVFEQVRDALETLLVSEETGYYITIVGQKQEFAAEDFKGDSRTIQIYYSEGDYSTTRSSHQKLQHDCVFSLQYNVASPAKADLSVLDDASASAAAKQTALANAQVGFVLADKLMDEFRRIITQVLMAPQNQDVGLTKFTLSNTWLSNFRKGQPLDKGNLVVITASESFGCRVTETVTGLTPTPGVQPVIDLTNLQRPLNDTGSPTDPPKSGIETDP